MSRTPTKHMLNIKSVAASSCTSNRQRSRRSQSSQKHCCFIVRPHPFWTTLVAIVAAPQVVSAVVEKTSADFRRNPCLPCASICEAVATRAMQFYMIPSAHAKEQGPGKPTREDYRNGVLQDIQESNEFGVSKLPGDTPKKMRLAERSVSSKTS